MIGAFTLVIVTPERALASVKDAVSLVAPAVEGYLGILPGHAPLLAQLIPGEISYTSATGTEEILATSGGFLEVSPEGVTILADSAERPDEIDVTRARSAYKRAADRLANVPEGLDIDRARLALQRAAARLRVTGQPTG